MTPDIREILQNLVGVCAIADIDIQEALSAIDLAYKKWMMEIVGDGKKMASHFDLCLLSNEDRASEEGEINGYNTAKQEIRERLTKEAL